MKRRLSIGLSILAVAAAIPFVSGTPVLAELQQAGSSLVQNILAPKVKLNLSAEKKIASVDAQGKQQVTWKAIDNTAVQPGDILRYTLVSENAGDKAAKNLTLTQPIPAQTLFVLESAKANGALLTYSIDGGKTFVEKPMVTVKLANGQEAQRPAPASAYTHIRWDYSDSLAPLASVRAAYEVAVK